MKYFTTKQFAEAYIKLLVEEKVGNKEDFFVEEVTMAGGFKAFKVGETDQPTMWEKMTGNPKGF